MYLSFFCCINVRDAKTGFMVFNATFNNISAISWRSVLLVEEAGGSRENLALTNFITQCCIEYTSP
jgi:hypothetical protein